MKITESELKEIIRETIEEGLLGKAKDFYRGFSIDDKEPTNYKEVFARCGYEIKDERPDNGGTLIYAAKKTGAFGAFNGDEPNDVVYGLKTVGVRAKFLGNKEDKQYLYVFKIF